MPSKRKAAGTSVTPRKIRRLEGDNLDSPRLSPSLQSVYQATNTTSGGDSDSEPDAPPLAALDDVPQRIKVLKALPKTMRETKSVSGTSNFAELGVSPHLVRALGTMSIRRPTPVQAACIPPLISGICGIGSSVSTCLLTRKRSGLHWQRKDWFWKNRRVCDTNLATACVRSVRDICTCTYPDKASSTVFATESTLID